MKIDQVLKQFKWRFLLVRIVVNALALAITAAVTPKIYFVDRTVLNWLLLTLMLGILNALLKPLLQFLTLQFIFVTYGLVIVLVNTLILGLLSLVFPDRFAVDSIWWLLFGGLVLGLVSSFLESLLGLTVPIVAEEPAKVRRQVEEQARHVDWLAATSNEAAAEEQAPAIEPPALAIEPPVAEAKAADTAAADPDTAEPPVPGQDVGASPPEEVEAEVLDAVATLPSEADISAEAHISAEGEISAEAAVTEDPEPAPEPGEEERENRS